MLLRLIVLLLCLSWLPLSGAPGDVRGPDERVVRQIRQIFPEWKLNSSGQCAFSRDTGLRAWKVVLERSININIKSSFAKDGKGYIIVVFVPDIGIFPGKEFIDRLDWRMPGNDLKQYTLYLGRGHGYHWYMKSDVARLEFFQRRMRLRDGEDMNRVMASALNEVDFQLFTSRIAMEYFRNKGPDVVPLIMDAMKEWKKEEKDPPVQHLISLKLTGSSAGAAELIKVAEGTDLDMAHLALNLLVEKPYLAPESFYLRALPVAEYTGRIIRIFRARGSMKTILPRLRKLVKAPRTIRQYTEVLGALREFDLPAGVKFKGIPEYQAGNDIMHLMMRMGETPDTIKYVPIEADGAGTPTKMAEEERKRITPHLEILQKSKDHEAVFAAAIVLSSYSPSADMIAPEYSSRVRRVGLEILRMLPPEFVTAHLGILERSLVLPKEKSLILLVHREYGGH